MLLVFYNNIEIGPGGDFICGPHCVDTKYVEGSAMFKRRDFAGRDTRAVVPAITVCRQNLVSLFEDEKLERHIKGQE